MMKTYEKATLAEYGYKDYRVWHKLFAVFTKGIAVVSIFIIYFPIIIIAIQSVNSSTDLAVFGHFTLRWYTQIFAHGTLGEVIKNTFLVSCTATLLATVLGTFIAVGIHSLEQKKRQHIMLLNNVPLLNADIVTGISLMLVFSLLLPIFPYLFGFPTLLLAHLFFTLPYVILSVLPKLREVDPNLMDAATDLGLKPYRALEKVVIPAIKAGIFSGMLLAFTMSVDDFVISYFNSGNGFTNLSVWIEASISKKNLTPAVYAFSTLLTILTLVGLFVYQLIMRRKGRTDK
ncbi:MAG: ABC transporter permease [Bacilli bacterium]|jgi:spermidine/putrescine transport system permease protein|nr:ABC transporter permease [Bacilli bacterium]